MPRGGGRTTHAAGARKKGSRQRSRPSSAAGVEQPDARRKLSYRALCAGTGISSGYLTKLGYTGEMVDTHTGKEAYGTPVTTGSA